MGIEYDLNLVAKNSYNLLYSGIHYCVKDSTYNYTILEENSSININKSYTSLDKIYKRDLMKQYILESAFNNEITYFIDEKMKHQLNNDCQIENILYTKLIGNISGTSGKQLELTIDIEHK